MGRQRRNPGGAGRRASSKAKQKKAAAQARALASGKERARTGAHAPPLLPLPARPAALGPPQP